MLGVADLLRISARQTLFRQSWRHWGVALAIALGTGGLILVIVTGRDVRSTISDDLELLGGVTVIRAYFEPTGPHSVPTAIEMAAASELCALPGVRDVSIVRRKVRPCASAIGKNRFIFQLVGVDDKYWQASGFSAIEGQLFGEAEAVARARVCVIGSKLAERMFGDKSAVGKFIPIENDIYQVVGILGGPGVGHQSLWVMLPLSTAKDRISDLARENRVYVRCESWDDVQGVFDAIPSVVERHQSLEGLRMDVGWEQLKHVKKVVWWIEVFIALSIVSTLCLGGFGIWNGMMSTVRARTREIGLKKAMGADDADILKQFLMESFLIGSVSGLLGVALGWSLVNAMSKYLGSVPAGDLLFFSACFGLGFSMVLGIVAGYYPAKRASGMEVLSAIRYE